MRVPEKSPVKSRVQRAATYFASPAKFRAWLKANHTKQTEFWVGFYKRESKLPSITWPESVAEALCFGWIDGLRQNVNAVSYRIRFTPRKPTSNWSAINIKRVAVLIAEGRMQDAGNKAFAERKAERSRIYAYENDDLALPPEYEKQLQKNKAAKKYFDSQSPSYRKGARRWILSAKQEVTRDARLAMLIECSAAKDFIPPYRWSMSAPSRKVQASQKKK
jgi:uncharacterized protein YdeI (YjbR/CyaY-like superfamily)